MLQPRDVRSALEHLINGSVVPIASKYGYAPQSLMLRSSWKPIVLIIGNYSSGKSTLINEMVGAPLQRTGQAPTDDCFTILAGPDDPRFPDPQPGESAPLLEEVPGSTIVNDPSLPFTGFKKFGSRFVSHFVMKKVQSPVLRNLVLIDSPGMLDSVAEQDRGYDYQEVVGRLAELADLVVLVFDPHRAGTIKETYVSIRSTLPRATSEDRVVFVMNRIDECKNLSDVLRCYGVLCWNLSQMTGRKDIPRIFLTYSPQLAKPTDPILEQLRGERKELTDKIEQAPRMQVSHWLGTLDNHLHRLELVVRTMANATTKWRWKVIGFIQGAVIASLVLSIVTDSVVAALVGRFHQSSIGRLFDSHFLDWQIIFLLMMLGLSAAGFTYYFRKHWRPAAWKQFLERLGECADLDHQYSRDLWDSVRSICAELLEDPKQHSWFAPHSANLAKVRRLISSDLAQLYELHLGQAPPREPEEKSE